MSELDQEIWAIMKQSDSKYYIDFMEALRDILLQGSMVEKNFMMVKEPIFPPTDEETRFFLMCTLQRINWLRDGLITLFDNFKPDTVGFNNCVKLTYLLIIKSNEIKNKAKCSFLQAIQYAILYFKQKDHLDVIG